MGKVGYLILILALAAVLFSGCVQPKNTISITRVDHDRPYVLFGGYNISVTGKDCSITSYEKAESE